VWSVATNDEVLLEIDDDSVDIHAPINYRGYINDAVWIITHYFIINRKTKHFEQTIYNDTTAGQQDKRRQTNTHTHTVRDSATETQTVIQANVDLATFGVHKCCETVRNRLCGSMS